MAGWVLSENTSEKHFTLPYDFKNGIAVTEHIVNDYGIDNVSSYTYNVKSSDIGETLVVSFSEGTFGGTISVSRNDGLPGTTEVIEPYPDGSRYTNFSRTILSTDATITFTFNNQSHIDITINGESVDTKDRLHLLGGTERKIVDDEYQEVRIPMTHYYTDGNDEWINAYYADYYLDEPAHASDIGNLDHDRTPIILYNDNLLLFKVYKDTLSTSYVYYRLYIYRLLYDTTNESYDWRCINLSHPLTGAYKQRADISVAILNDFIYVFGNEPWDGGVTSKIYKVNIDIANDWDVSFTRMYLNDSTYGTIGPYSIAFKNAIHNFGGGRYGDEHWKWDGSNYTSVSTLPQGGITGVTVYNNELYAIFNDDVGQLYKFNSSNNTWSEVPNGYLGVGSDVSLITVNSDINILGGSSGSRLRSRWNPTDGEWYPRSKDILGPIKNGWVNVITGWRDTYAMIGDREVYTGKEYIRTPKKIKNGWKITEDGSVQILREVNHMPHWDNTIIPEPYADTSFIRHGANVGTISKYESNEFIDEIHVISDSKNHYVCRQNENIWEWEQFSTGLPSGFYSPVKLFSCGGQLYLVWQKSGSTTHHLSRFNYYSPGYSPSQTGVYSWQQLSTISRSGAIRALAYWAISTNTYNYPDTIYRMMMTSNSNDKVGLRIDRFDISTATWITEITYIADRHASGIPDGLIGPIDGWLSYTAADYASNTLPIIGGKNVSYYLDDAHQLIKIDHVNRTVELLGATNAKSYNGQHQLFFINSKVHYINGDTGIFYYYDDNSEETIISDTFYNEILTNNRTLNPYGVYVSFDHTPPDSINNWEESLLIHVPHANSFVYKPNLLLINSEDVYIKDLLPE